MGREEGRKGKMKKKEGGEMKGDREKDKTGRRNEGKEMEGKMWRYLTP